MAVKRLYIFPFNGNGLEALDCLSAEEFDFVGFIDDDPEKQDSPSPWPVMPRSQLSRDQDARVLAVPGGPATYRQREQAIAYLGLPRERLASVVHPRAVLGRGTVLGVNCLVMAGVVMTSNARIGDHVCLLPNSVVHHDAVIGDYTLIGSLVSVAGGVQIGCNCYIGSGSNLIQGIQIGDGALVGLGSNVIRSVSKGLVVAGNPARPLRRGDAGYE